MKFVTYFRVSTKRQGQSGLGLQAQKTAIRPLLKGRKPIAEFQEVESGKNNNRPQLKQAIELCQEKGATLLIAKLDRLSRSVTFISQLQDAGIDFKCADMPDASKLTIHIFAALAQHERELISQRTKAALREAKKKGKRLGYRNPKVRRGIKRSKKLKDDKPHLRRSADAFALSLKDEIKIMLDDGYTIVGITERFNKLKKKARRGGPWTRQQLTKVIERLEAMGEIDLA